MADRSFWIKRGRTFALLSSLAGCDTDDSNEKRDTRRLRARIVFHKIDLSQFLFCDKHVVLQLLRDARHHTLADSGRTRDS